MAATRIPSMEGPASSLEDEVRRSYAQIVDLVSELLAAHLDALRRFERNAASSSDQERHLRVVPATGALGDALTFEALGRDRALVWVDGGQLALSQRHSEIVVLLAAHPAGLTAEQLALALYGEQGKPQTARAEVSRLRRLLRSRIETDPYRLAVPARSDVADVQRLLRDGHAGDAAVAYRGALLPRSDAPGVVDLRNELDGWTRRAALASDDTEVLWSWLNTPSGEDDIQAWKRLLSSIPHEDGRRPLAAARLERLRPAFAVTTA